MNLDDMLRRERLASPPNPLVSRTGEIIAGVRRRRRARAAGAGAASVATMAAVAVIVWQVGAPRQVLPLPPADPTVVCDLTVDTLRDVPAGDVAAESTILPGDGTAAVVVSTLVNTGEEAVNAGFVGNDAYAVDPVNGRVRGFFQDLTGQESSIIIEPGAAAEVTEVVTFEACGGGPLADGEYDLLVRGPLRPSEPSSSDAVLWFSALTRFAVADGAVADRQAPTEAPTESTEGPSDEPTEEPTDDPTEDPTGEMPPSVQASVPWEPVCGEPFDPPTMQPRTQYTGLEVTGSFGRGPWAPAPGPTDGLETTLFDVANTTVTERIERGVYTWTVLVRNGVVMSPQLLGSDDVVDISLEPGGTAQVRAGHPLADFCAAGWTPSEPLVDLAPGEYEAYVLLMDLDAYNADGTRAVLAVSAPSVIEIVTG